MKSMHLEWPFFKWMRPVLEIGVGFTLFIGFVYLVRARDFRSAASVLASVLTIYVAIAALFFNRARGLPRGPSKIRSLYAAERATQGIAFTLVGTVAGIVIFAWGIYFEYSLHPAFPLVRIWPLLFILPLAFILWGYVAFTLALRVISREFLHPLSAKEVARRIKGAP